MAAPSSVTRFVSASVPIALPGCFVPCMPVIGVLGRCLSLAAPLFPSGGLIFSLLVVCSWAFASGFCTGEKHGLQDSQSAEKGVGCGVRAPIPRLDALRCRFFCMHCLSGGSLAPVRWLFFLHFPHSLRPANSRCLRTIGSSVSKTAAYDIVSPTQPSCQLESVIWVAQPPYMTLRVDHPVSLLGGRAPSATFQRSSQPLHQIVCDRLYLAASDIVYTQDHHIFSWSLCCRGRSTSERFFVIGPHIPGPDQTSQVLGAWVLRKLKQAFTVDRFDDIVLLMSLLAPAAS